MASENITKVLYPNDEVAQGKILRLQQQFFFVSCSLQDMIRLHLPAGTAARAVPRDVGRPAQRHPPGHRRGRADAAARRRARAWPGTRRGTITQKTLGYTNHTLLPEALEKWPVELFGGLLPRHLEIIYEINRRFLDEVRARFPGDDGRVARMSIIDEGGERAVRMAHLADGRQPHGQRRRRAALPAAHRDGAARLLRAVAGQVLQRHQRRHAAPLRGREQPAAGAAHHRARSATAGCSDLGQLRAPRAAGRRRGVPAAVARGQADRQARAWRRSSRSGPASAVDPDALFDVQVKRLHEYKRQHLNVLHILTLYLRLKRDPAADIPPRTFLFGAKAAPGYVMAKLHHQADQRGRPTW